MGSVKTWSSAETKASLSKTQTVVTTSILPDEESKSGRGCFSLLPDGQTVHSTGWKPLSMSTPILAALVLLTLLIAAAIEVLAQRSAAYGGLGLSPSRDAIPKYAMWSYLYGPNIVAVLYSLIWSWVDLDVKRMQPWFELSKDGGATAEDSLFLDYPFDFVAIAPWKALKKRHWPVFLAGTTMIVVFWAVTPLQSAILGTGVVGVVEPVSVFMRSKLKPVKEHVNALDPQFLNNGYAVGWLNQSMPPFTTQDYSYLPFYVNDTQFQSPNTSWSAITTRYSTELDCKPVEGTQHEATPTTWDFINDRGCNATINLSAFANYTMLYIGYHTSPFSDFALGSPRCPLSTDSTHQFLAIWAETIKGSQIGEADWNITAAFCETQYWKEKVELTVSSNTLTPLGPAEPLSSRENLTDDEFNRTAFEFLLGNGMSENVVPKDLPFSQVVEQHPRLDGTNLYLPVSNMVGYALAGHVLPTDEYSNLDTLKEAYSRAHSYLFSLAMRQLQENSTDTIDSVEATVAFVQHGITVSRTFSAVVEGILVLVAISTSILICLIRSAQSHLPNNPSSITRIGDLLRKDFTFMSRLQTVDNADDASLASALSNVRLRLIRTSDHSARTSAHLLSYNDWTVENSGAETSLSRAKYYEPIRPFALRRWAGLGFMVMIMAASAGLSYLKVEEINKRGLIRPTDNTEVLQLIENYIPTVFATLVEPFWVLLTRLLCMLQPFRDLWKGHAAAKSTVQSTYTAIPPQIVAWRALKSRHFLLVILCLMVFLSNLLAVGLGALFNEAPIVSAYPQQFKALYAARFNNDSVIEFESYLSERIKTTSFYQDHMYVALANYTSATHLPPWTTREFFFQPHDLDSLSDDDVRPDSYSLITRGFGASGNCLAWSTSEVPVEMEDVPALAADSDECPNFIEAVQSQIRLSTLTRPSGQSAVEQIAAYVAPNIVENCGLPLNMAFGRTPDGQDLNGTVKASYAICRPFFETAMFNVTVDTSGSVLNATRIGEVETSLKYDQAELHQQLLINKATQLIASSAPQWHNDTLSRNWMVHFMTVLADSRSFLDPAEPPPDLEELRPTMESIYRTLFAILLSLNQHLFEAPESADISEASASDGVSYVPEVRIFMDTTAFIISMIVLGLNIIVASLFYLRTSAFVLPRMPSTIGSVMAYIAPSRTLWDRQVEVNDKAQTYSFGRFLGQDGQVHLGVEVDPHVALIEPASLTQKDSALSNMLRFRRMGNTKPKGPWV
ncbi:hypothetical protein CC79DRAFT_772673 [Sarocladium strictum]